MAVRPRLAIAALLAAAAAAALVFLPAEAWLLALAERMRASGPAAWLIFGAAYTAGTVLLVPGTLLTLVAGFAYGPLGGFALVSPVSVVAATAAFLVGRFLARDWAAAKAQADPRFGAVDRAIRGNAFKVVLLLRLSPIFPFNLLNYALSITAVPTGTYVLASFLGMIPGTFLYVYLGSLVTSAAELAAGRPSAGPYGQALFAAGLAATVAVTWLVTRMARRELEKMTGGRRGTDA